jgi:hypothetical protein
MPVIAGPVKNSIALIGAVRYGQLGRGKGLLPSPERGSNF